MATWKERIQFFSPPRLSDSVHREECTQCFDSQDGDDGIDVCLSCFNGGCLGPERHHARTHFDKTKHPLSLNIKRRPKPRRDEQEPPTKKLAIQEEREEDKYTYATCLRSWPDQGQLIPDASENPKVKTLVDGVMTSMSSARQSEVKAWEEEIEACEHTLTLQQTNNTHIKPNGLAHCSKCELGENLWLCLSCGSLGCGRQQFGGTGGNGHGLNHYEETKHPVAVKLGTITAEGAADIYCYDCNDSRLDLDLAKHLANFGINVAQQTKTEKTMTELQIEQNLKFDFSLTGEDGKLLQPLFGPGLTGLSNLGNSCYMASTLQSIIALPSFRSRYASASAAAEHALTCTEPSPALCVECQMYKVADGLLSGRYSHPRPRPSSSETTPPEDDGPVFQEGIKPTMFKALIGKGHVEFSTMKQQDAEEFFTHLLKVLRQDYKKHPTNFDPTEVFRHGVEQRLECQNCHRVSYRVDSADVVSVPVPSRPKGKSEDGKTIYEAVKFVECLDQFSGIEGLEYRCPSCNKSVTALKQSKFSTFPDVLVVHARKFQLVDWVPQKLDIPLELPASNEISLDSYLGKGHQPGEELLPSESTGTASAPSQPEYNQEALSLLEGMGFPLIRSQKALLATGNSDGNAAMEWLFAHMDDPDIDEPIPVAAQAGGQPEPPAESISAIADMGFNAKQAKKALKQTGNDLERAIDWLFSHPDDDGEDSSESGPAAPTASNPGGSSTLPARYRLKAFISHKGPSVHSGHYVAHVRVSNDEWAFFNDEKVVRADSESLEQLKPYAYLYIFERV